MSGPDSINSLSKLAVLLTAAANYLLQAEQAAGWHDLQKLHTGMT